MALAGASSFSFLKRAALPCPCTRSWVSGRIFESVSSKVRLFFHFFLVAWSKHRTHSEVRFGSPQPLITNRRKTTHHVKPSCVHPQSRQAEAEIEHLHSGVGGTANAVAAQAGIPEEVLFSSPDADDTAHPQQDDDSKIASESDDDLRGLGKWFKLVTTKKSPKERVAKEGGSGELKKSTLSLDARALADKRGLSFRAFPAGTGWLHTLSFSLSPR